MYKVKAAVLPQISFYGTIVHTGSWGHENVTKQKHLLVLANSGTFHISVLGKTYEMEPDTVLFIPKNTPYSLHSVGTIQHVVLHFDIEIEDAQLNDGHRETSERAFWIPSSIKADVFLRSKIERAAVPASDNTFLEIERSLALMRALLAMASLNESHQESILVKKMKQYLQQHMTERITLEELSRTFGYTKQYLIRIFKRETGRSPIQYLNEQRLFRSTAELLNAEKSIAEVARSCGFDDYNYFSRAFRRQFGFSPREYRKKTEF